jgi:hypothetical protein
VEAVDKCNPGHSGNPSGIGYRLAGRGDYVECHAVELSGSGIDFQGDMPLAEGRAAEVRLVSEARITPPLTAYIEVIRCERTRDGQFRVAGKIKGIKSE